MKNQLKEKKTAILATDGFEQSEFEKPLEALKKEKLRKSACETDSKQ